MPNEESKEAQEISPAMCPHKNQMFLQGGRGTGVNYSESSNISLCRDCGSFLIFKYENGASFHMEFVLRDVEALDTAGTWVRYLQQCEKEREANFTGAVKKERGAELSDIQVPSNGRRVHYVPDGVSHDRYPEEHKAATVVHVEVEHTTDTVLCNLQVLFSQQGGLVYFENVPYNPELKPGTWHWPERN